MTLDETIKTYEKGVALAAQLKLKQLADCSRRIEQIDPETAEITPLEEKAMDYREQYQRYVAMVEETIEQVLPQTGRNVRTKCASPAPVRGDALQPAGGGQADSPGAAAGDVRNAGRRYPSGARAGRRAGNDSHVFTDSR